MIILGIDPANITGWAIIDGDEITCGTWRLVVSSEEHPGDRLSRFVEQLRTIYCQTGFEIISIEDSGFSSNNKTTVTMHEHLIGMATWFASQKSIRVIKCNISSVKKFISGKGNAEKYEVIAAVNRHYGLRISDNNEADAIAIAKYGEYELLHGHPKTVKSKTKRHVKPTAKQQTFFGSGRRGR
jgi:crossover junction endodeoxyribonuclease RuvC